MLLLKNIASLQVDEIKHRDRAPLESEGNLTLDLPFYAESKVEGKSFDYLSI
jgi:hypothetical protein